MTTIAEQRIQQRAYEIWEREGRPDGQSETHWRQAADELARDEAEQTSVATDPADTAAAESRADQQPIAATAGSGPGTGTARGRKPRGRTPDGPAAGSATATVTNTGANRAADNADADAATG